METERWNTRKRGKRREGGEKGRRENTRKMLEMMSRVENGEMKH